MAENLFGTVGGERRGNDSTFREAVCINTARIYDSCGEKDCLEDLRVFFTDAVQPIVDSAYSVKARSVDVIDACLCVEPVPFNQGFFSVDITYYFVVQLDACTSPINPSIQVCGLAVAHKKVILFGSEGSVKIFTNNHMCDKDHVETSYLPRARLQVAQPMLLACEITDCGEIPIDCGISIPCNIARQFEGSFESVVPQRIVTVTIGIFSIVQLERQVQMLIPVYDFCIPEKECVTSSAEPCDIFEKIQFPVDQFFPPRMGDRDKDDKSYCNMA